MQGSRPLPPQVHLLTLKRLPGGELLLRLAHLYQTGEQGSGEQGAARARRSRFKGSILGCMPYANVVHDCLHMIGILGCALPDADCSVADGTGG